MAKNGRPPASLDEWLDWKQRLESQKASGLSVSVFCLQEGVSLSGFLPLATAAEERCPRVAD